jgi:hypothetical protein
MQPLKLKKSERTKKNKEQPDLCESRIEIRFVPLPPERRAGYEAALLWIYKLMEEQRAALSGQPLARTLKSE